MSLDNEVRVAERDAYFDDYGEDGQFRANGNATARDIDVVVTRMADDMPAGGLVGKRPVLRAMAKNTETRGILSTEIDEGINQIAVAKRVGASLEWFKFKIIDQDAGTVTFELR